MQPVSNLLSAELLRRVKKSCCSLPYFVHSTMSQHDPDYTQQWL